MRCKFMSRGAPRGAPDCWCLRRRRMFWCGRRRWWIVPSPYRWEPLDWSVEIACWECQRVRWLAAPEARSLASVAGILPLRTHTPGPSASPSPRTPCCSPRPLSAPPGVPDKYHSNSITHSRVTFKSWNLVKFWSIS